MAKYDDYDWDELPSEVKAAGKVYLLHIRDLLIVRSSPREEVEHRLTSFFCHLSIIICSCRSWIQQATLGQ